MDFKDYLTIAISVCAYITSVLGLFISIARYRHEKPKANIIDIDFERYFTLLEYENINGDFSIKYDIFIVAKVSNDSLAYPLKLNYAEVEYRKRQPYRTKKGTYFRERILIDETIDKGKNNVFKFYFRGTLIPYDKNEENAEIELPQDLMINRIRFHYASRNTNWFILGEMFCDKYTINIREIKKRESKQEPFAFILSHPRFIKNKKAYIINEKVKQNIKHYLKHQNNK